MTTKIFRRHYQQKLTRNAELPMERPLQEKCGRRSGRSIMRNLQLRSLVLHPWRSLLRHCYPDRKARGLEPGQHGPRRSQIKAQQLLHLNGNRSLTPQRGRRRRCHRHQTRRRFSSAAKRRSRRNVKCQKQARQVQLLTTTTVVVDSAKERWR